MTSQNRLQSSRYELKYIVSEAIAAQARDFSLSHLEPDDHTVGPGLGYRVNSLYLDRPDLFMYQSVLKGEKNRLKLRMRFYDDQPKSPVFLEIKRRTSYTTLKERAAVTRAGADQLLQSHWASPSDLLNQSPKAVDVQRHFSDLRKRLGAEGQAVVSYCREAYVSPESSELRVTFDREIVGSRYRAEEGLIAPVAGVRAKVKGVVLELKFTNRFPKWMRELVQVFNLQRCSVPKYVMCVDAIQNREMNRGTVLSRQNREIMR